MGERGQWGDRGVNFMGGLTPVLRKALEDRGGGGDSRKPSSRVGAKL